MKNPKIELKKVKMFNGHDGVGLDCDLYVDGKKVAHVFDSARGGGNEYQEYGNTLDEIKVNRKILTDLEEYAKTQTYICEFDGKESTKNLDIIINELLDVVEKEKQAKKMVKEFETKICAGIPNGDSYRTWTFGKPAVQLNRMSISYLQANIDIIKTKLKEGEVILNTNLQILGINI